MTLEELIRKHARFGALNHLTLAFTAQGWAAAYRDTKSVGYRMEHRDDPVDALLSALGQKTGTHTPVKNEAAYNGARKRRKPVDDDLVDILGV